MISSFRAALLHFGHGEWELIAGEWTRVAKHAALVLGCLLLYTVCGISPAQAAAPITARVIVPKAKPHALEVYVTVEPRPENRGFSAWLTCDGEPVTSTFRQLDGASSRGPFPPIVWTPLPDCTYLVSVAVIGPDGRPTAYAKPTVIRVGVASTPSMFEDR